MVVVVLVLVLLLLLLVVVVVVCCLLFVCFFDVGCLLLAHACSAPSQWPRKTPCGDDADAKLANSDMIQAGHIWFFHVAVCLWVLGLPLALVLMLVVCCAVLFLMLVVCCYYLFSLSIPHSRRVIE